MHSFPTDPFAPKPPFTPDVAAQKFKVPNDLVWEQVLAEPAVKQPVFLNFDEKGRMWVIQYLQYPHPAGLKIVSRDSVWRAIYDKVPPAPPNHVRGDDKITIHQDLAGDGTYAKQKTFIDGLNIVTSIARGRGGIWMLHPPYLLFYPDRNDDDVPDGDPEVHLSGFGMEDTHSVVNSLRWGPDGWLYAAQGSTVTAHVRQPGSNAPPVSSLGQLIWRYRPPRDGERLGTYEIFAEGGGNAFGVEFDKEGHVYSGHNGGDTRGFHYVQGGYYLKGFGKHGPLSNPYTFGYFPAMRHNQVPRFTHTFRIYDGDNLPERYRGKLFGVAPLLHHVVLSDVQMDGSSRSTKDLEHVVSTTDPWFTPVDVKQGPDGALYVADWYDGQCGHYRSHEGQIDKSNGRIYRLRGQTPAKHAPTDLSKLSSAELVGLLEHPNQWHRETARRLLGDRRDASVVPSLRQLLARDGHVALEALWALHETRGPNEEDLLAALQHSHPPVRRWAIRLAGDEKRLSTTFFDKCLDLAARDTDVQVRSQLASTARRLYSTHSLPLIQKLAARGEDANDVHVPLLLWWALERQITVDPASVVKLFADPAWWDLPLVRSHLAERTMRRFAATGKPEDLQHAITLWRLVPSDEHAKNAQHAQRLLAGFEAAYAGRSLTNLPPELAQILERHSKFSVALGLRQQKPEAVAAALQTLLDPKADRERRRQLLQVMAEVDIPAALGVQPVLLELLRTTPDEAFASELMAALQRYGDPTVAAAILARYPNWNDSLRSLAQSVLLSRKSWALSFLEALDAGKLVAANPSPEAVRPLLELNDPHLTVLVRKHWKNLQLAAPAELQKEIDRLERVLQGGVGFPKTGRKLYVDSCGKCHALFGAGGQVGPDLTSYQRDDLKNMLLHVVHPNAELREGYVSTLVLTKSGVTVQGIEVERSGQRLVLRTIENALVTIAADEIDESRGVKTSLMPEGLLKGMKEQEVRDLFAYLRATQPVID